MDEKAPSTSVQSEKKPAGDKGKPNTPDNPFLPNSCMLPNPLLLYLPILLICKLTMQSKKDIS